jgi:hypothetical protein
MLRHRAPEPAPDKGLMEMFWPAVHELSKMAMDAGAAWAVPGLKLTNEEYSSAQKWIHAVLVDRLSIPSEKTLVTARTGKTR